MQTWGLPTRRPRKWTLRFEGDLSLVDASADLRYLVFAAGDHRLRVLDLRRGGRRGRERRERLLTEGVHQDRFDGVVPVLADGMGAGTGGPQARGPKAFGRPEHALGTAQGVGLSRYTT